ncbi:MULTISPECIES: cob(I)yrinic acid a,c-diamide adenosyltransferase [unclassified Paracoccus (in: a-proteobacteria)]|uniref:cob(I)yrinic acid a,c-diamide adenosyltransferase n=1 Tax=unclassified Paracoccus (in: a-proteobacteria) TaxID=2688777 RepID=UPI00160319E4|nr:MULTISPECIES: cob(I)yrinic acid a,c-diamide adenosyltransferase [unclassified Paracoccus (in: a-proteobacteria)]MBB1493224.1 cob(I)yrinic acid a,c-diamide adenosyltransferase [Paracoccus sp. MC1854]MBB1499693.1 cob(I)yrinic acid a,c-diamide adenosyltransferase [Paracoccus sp. MC1862]QQO44429.1 cob(I)yrinic acid a,c-diamide adenosyltransferase [Paracoccus sp. MC1862]
MVVLNRIYTRTGDKGDTGLSDGSRVAKHDPRVEAYGTVDELNATLGLARLHAGAEMADALGVIQNELFDLGADLARPNMDRDAEAPYPVLRIVQQQVDRLEIEIDAMNAPLSALRSFILPGGSLLAAHLHLSRTVARRAERRATELAEGGDTNPAAVRYLNRLSDWLFVAARAANAGGKGDVLWVPGASRGGRPDL